MGPALQAAFMVMSPIGGKLLLFQSAVPSLGAHVPPAHAIPRLPRPPPFYTFGCQIRRSWWY